jgi:hypothetical protein
MFSYCSAFDQPDSIPSTLWRRVSETGLAAAGLSR